MPDVVVPLAPGFEELEAVTVIDLLVRAGISVISAGLEPGPVRGSRGVVLVPDMTLDEALAREFDMVVLPGGAAGADNLDKDPRVLRLLRNMAGSGKFTAAICAAPKVLANAGLLDGRRATSYPGFVDQMDLPTTTYVTDAVVQDGTVVTSRGPGTAMDFALRLIELLVGRAKRDQVETGLVRSLG